MPLTSNWFVLNEKKSDIDNVLGFLELLPKNFRQIFEKKSSNFLTLLKDDENYGINSSLFISAFEEADKNLKASLKSFRLKLKIDSLNNSDEINDANKILSEIGFTNNSLKLKAGLLNKLWSLLRSSVQSTGKAIIDFTNNSVKKLLKKFLDYLNSLLDSLTNLISGVDAIKELKEIIESYIDLDEE